MKRFVLDASVALAWFVDDPVPAYANFVRQDFLQEAKAIVPSLWYLEIANGLVMGQRRGVLTAADAEHGLNLIESLVGARIDVDTAFVSIRQAFTTAREFGLNAYDAVYLDLARREKLLLATLDRNLRAAASKAEVELLR